MNVGKLSTTPWRQFLPSTVKSWSEAVIVNPCSRKRNLFVATNFNNGVMDKRRRVSRRVGCRAHAQMVIDNLFKRREVCSTFYFEYLVDGEDKLKHIFWADPICRRNFAALGDSVSFDATYNTNRYKMVFTPFTGKNNHGKCVTFGAALLSSENTESYCWVLEKFKDCMCRPPSMLITDQDSALKNAVKHVFPDIRHRLCMRHIMLKFSDKLSPHLKKDKSLRQQTPILFEKHVAVVYTTNIFVKVQKEISSTYFKCRIMSITKNEHQLFYDVNDGDGIFQVVYDSVEETVVCSCSKFVREGLLCCHIYILLKDLNVDRIPDKYVVRRWTRSCFDSVNGCLTDLVSSCAAVDENKIKINICISEFYACVGVADGDDEKLSALLHCVRDFKEFLKHETSEEGIESDKNRIFYNFYGSSYPTQVDVLLPDVVKTKGSDRIPDKYVVRRWTRSCFDSVNGCLTDLVSSCAAVDENKIKINTCISEFYACVGVADGDDEKLSALLHCVRDCKEFLKHETSEEGIESDKNRIFYNFYGSSRPTQVDVLLPDVVKTKGSGS
ncbi:hypothetical protein C2S52_008985 [Perilla frutescens var. hirtella]|nr:hypothetical protein C2S52_008985 [Perilla frutescens var. hirtella]